MTVTRQMWVKLLPGTTVKYEAETDTFLTTVRVGRNRYKYRTKRQDVGSTAMAKNAAAMAVG